MASKTSFDVFGLQVQVRVSRRPCQPSGRAALLLHGFPDNSSLWDKQVPVLEAAGFPCIVPDLLGCGGSAKPTDVALYTLDAQSSMLVEILDQLGVDKVAVVGHDWGAALAWHFAQVYPERVQALAALSVGSLGTFFSGGGNEQRQKSWYMLFFLQPDAEELLEADEWALFKAFSKEKDPEIAGPIMAGLADPATLTGGLAWYRANITASLFAQVKPMDLPMVQCPTMGVWSTGDLPYLTEEQMLSSQVYVEPGNWRYERVEGPGHFIPRDSADKLNALLLDFLAKSRA